MKPYEELLYLTEDQHRKIQEMVRRNRQDPGIRFFDLEHTTEHYIPVANGEIRCFHHHPPVTDSQKPIVFISGWGTIPEGFSDFFNIVDKRIECYYIETREKNSSRMDRRRAQFDMDRQARDVQTAINEMGLAKKNDFILIGTCWGSTIIAHGLARGIISAPVVVLFDPMYSLWFPKWILNYIVPVTPVWLWQLIKPIAKRIAVFGMREKHQRQRAESFIDNGTLWKWKRAAWQARRIDLYESVGRIQQEVIVINGVQDKIHDNAHYPRLAALMPQGRFFYMKVDESQREYLIGATAAAFAGGGADNGTVPAFFREFEKEIRS